ncbi:MAG: hypothetical protein ACHQVS_00420 [Candidatus Babeliales bacterium]
MKIELLKQRFMHLGLLTCLIVGGTMTTMSHANMNKIMADVITALENAQRNDLANTARQSKERLTALLHTAKSNLECRVDQSTYTHTVNQICKEFVDFKRDVETPMAHVENCAHEYGQLRLAIDTLAKVIAILKNISGLNPTTRGLVAKKQLDPYKNEFISA